jgi:hypothetical protein
MFVRLPSSGYNELLDNLGTIPDLIRTTVKKERPCGGSTHPWVDSTSRIATEQAIPGAREMDVATIIPAVTREDLGEYERNS